LLEEQSEVSLESIKEARNRIAGYAFRTPAYSAFSVEHAWLKLECYQPVRSFKIRGASNKILSINDSERKKRGVITPSSGNHGLAVAYVANRLGIKATIVLPENVIPDKLEMIKSLGAIPVLSGRQQDERAKKAEEISRDEGQIIIQPFNDATIVSGQGTCGLELVEDVRELEKVFVPIGGGGLISGVAASIKLNPKTSHIKVIGVQPEGSRSMYESFKKGELSTIPRSQTIADGLSVRKPGDITFALVKRYVDEIMLVSDNEILETTYRLLRKEHVLSEPSGAAAFAGLLKSRKDSNTTLSAAIVSGGNISQEVLSRILSAF
jgi:threonine dehydratase